jgi:hypothetical protein
MLVFLNIPGTADRKGGRPRSQDARENISAGSLFLVAGIFYIYLTFRKVCRKTGFK